MKTHVGAIGWRKYVDDRLVVRWENLKTGEKHNQGKRVSAKCPLEPKYRRVYVTKGIVDCVKSMRADNPLMLFSEAVNIINAARG